ncbi:MAG: hypothetical protein QOF51_2422 [Chloroflexota bacterium]|nr:hypothetical protein [Chloroflexota bacterium]
MGDEAVLEANEAFYRAFNQKDVAAMDALWAQDAPVACIHPGWTALHDRESVMESWRGILSNPAQPRVVTGSATVSFVGEIALVLCRELVSGTPLAATNIFINEAGAWRLIHHHSSPVSYLAD